MTTRLLHLTDPLKINEKLVNKDTIISDYKAYTVLWFLLINIMFIII